MTRLFGVAALVAAGYGVATLFGSPQTPLTETHPATTSPLVSDSNWRLPVRPESGASAAGRLSTGAPGDLHLRADQGQQKAAHRQPFGTSDVDTAGVEPTPARTPNPMADQPPQWLAPVTSSVEPTNFVAAERGHESGSDVQLAWGEEPAAESPDTVAGRRRPTPLSPASPALGKNNSQNREVQRPTGMNSPWKGDAHVAGVPSAGGLPTGSLSVAEESWSWHGTENAELGPRPVYQTVFDFGPGQANLSRAAASEHSSISATGGSMRPASGAHPAEDMSPAAGISATHIVADGDTLHKLAELYLDDPSRSWEIFHLNQDVLRGPELLPIGSLLKIPPRNASPNATPATSAPHQPAEKAPVGPTTGTMATDEGTMVPVRTAPRQPGMPPHARLLEPVPLENGR